MILMLQLAVTLFPHLPSPSKANTLRRACMTSRDIAKLDEELASINSRLGHASRPLPVPVLPVPRLAFYSNGLNEQDMYSDPLQGLDRKLESINSTLESKELRQINLALQNLRQVKVQKCSSNVAYYRDTFSKLSSHDSPPCLLSDRECNHDSNGGSHTCASEPIQTMKQGQEIVHQRVPVSDPTKKQGHRTEAECESSYEEFALGRKRQGGGGPFWSDTIELCAQNA